MNCISDFNPGCFPCGNSSDQGGSSDPPCSPCSPKIKKKQAISNDEQDIPAVEKRTHAAGSSILDSNNVDTYSESALPKFRMDDPFKNSTTLNSPLSERFSEQSSKKIDAKAANFKVELEKYRYNLTDFDKQYNSWQEFFKDIGSSFGKGLALGEYFDDNGENIRSSLKQAVSSENYETTAGRIKQFGKIFKWIDLTFPFIINLWKYYIITKLQTQFNERLEEWRKLKLPPNLSNALSNENSDSLLSST